MFDMKKDKWFIRTPTPEISEAVIEWLKKQHDLFLHKSINSSDLHKDYGLKTCLSGDGPNTAIHGVCYSPSDFYEREDFQEIKLTFKTSVASVEYPFVETQAEKELKALEQKIQELTEQASKLRSVIK